MEKLRLRRGREGIGNDAAAMRKRTRLVFKQ
jgi:hypothetical protein